MEKTERVDSTWWMGKLLWIGVGMGFFYWLLESLLHVFVFKDGNFASQIFIYNPHELWKRLLIASLIIGFSFYAQQKLNQQKKAEEALKESEKKYRTIFEDALNPVVLLSEDGSYIDCNQAALDFLEYRRDDIIGREFWDLLSQGQSAGREIWYSPMRDIQNLETDFSIKGRTKTLLLNLVPFASKENSFVYGIGQDISERKQMEREIKMAHTELDHIFQTASTGMRLIDKDFNILKVNPSFSALAGINLESAPGKKCYEVFSGSMCQKPECPLTRILKGEKGVDCETEKQREDGSRVSCLLTARPFHRPGGELVGIVESFNDISELKRAQEDLRSERDKLHRILFHRYEGVGIVNRDFIVEYQNDTLKGQVGDSEGKFCYEALMERKRPCEPCVMKETVNSGKPSRFEFDTAAGWSYELTYTPFKETDGEDKILITLRDVTQIKAARAAAIQSEQLAALGSMAAGVAHEINNPINGIINYGQILINKSDQKEVVASIAERVVKEGDRIATIVERMLSFARREKQTKASSHIKDILYDSLALIAAQMLKESIDVKVNIPFELPPVFVSFQEMQQVFINILNNAQYSLNQKYPGSDQKKVIEINAETVFVNGECRVKVSFLDGGTGIPAGVIDKVLNPFFSTKPKGKGTGLGLSVSHGIVTDHGGSLSVKSVEGEYTLIDLELPVEKVS